MKKTENFEVVKNEGTKVYEHRFAIVWRGDTELSDIFFEGSRKSCNKEIDRIEKKFMEHYHESINNDVPEWTAEVEERMRDQQNMRLEAEAIAAGLG